MPARLSRSGRCPAPPARRLGAVLIALCLAATALLGLGCEGPPAPGGGEGPGHRGQTLALSPEQELRLGRQAYREILGNPGEYGHPLPADHPEGKRVRAVVARIA